MSVSLGVLNPTMLMMVLLTFRLTRGEKFMTLSFEVGAKQTVRNLTCGDQ